MGSPLTHITGFAYACIAGALGMTIQMLQTVHCHHHPDWQEDASEV